MKNTASLADVVLAIKNTSRRAAKGLYSVDSVDAQPAGDDVVVTVVLKKPVANTGVDVSTLGTPIALYTASTQGFITNYYLSFNAGRDCFVVRFVKKGKTVATDKVVTVKYYSLDTVLSMADLGVIRKVSMIDGKEKLSALSPRAIRALVTVKAPTRRRSPANNETKDKK